MRVTRCGIGIQSARQHNPRQCETRCRDSDCPTQHAPALPRPPSFSLAARARLSERWAAAQGPRRLLQRNIRMFRSTAIFTSAAPLVPSQQQVGPPAGSGRPQASHAGGGHQRSGCGPGCPHGGARRPGCERHHFATVQRRERRRERVAVAARLQVAPRIRSVAHLEQPCQNLNLEALFEACSALSDDPSAWHLRCQLQSGALVHLGHSIKPYAECNSR